MSERDEMRRSREWPSALGIGTARRDAMGRLVDYPRPETFSDAGRVFHALCERVAEFWTCLDVERSLELLNDVTRLAGLMPYVVDLQRREHDRLMREVPEVVVFGGDRATFASRAKAQRLRNTIDHHERMLRDAREELADVESLLGKGGISTDGERG